MTLSSTKAEYVALSEVATEILYICSILRFLQVKQEFPIEVHVDNVGAIYLSTKEKQTEKAKSKHRKSGRGRPYLHKRIDCTEVVHIM